MVCSFDIGRGVVAIGLRVERLISKEVPRHLTHNIEDRLVGYASGDKLALDHLAPGPLEYIFFYTKQFITPKYLG